MSFSSDQPLLSNQLPISIDFAENQAIFLDQLTLLYKRIADTVNKKEGSVYSIQENATFKQYPTADNPQQFKNVYRKTFDMIDLNGGNIAGGATVSFPHDITGLFAGTLIYAGCTSTDPRYFSIMGPNDVWLDATNVNFTNPLGTPLTHCYVVAEYLKN